jgi:hypothetical protein
MSQTIPHNLNEQFQNIQSFLHQFYDKNIPVFEINEQTLTLIEKLSNYLKQQQFNIEQQINFETSNTEEYLNENKKYESILKYLNIDINDFSKVTQEYLYNLSQIAMKLNIKNVKTSS